MTGCQLVLQGSYPWKKGSFLNIMEASIQPRDHMSRLGGRDKNMKNREHGQEQENQGHEQKNQEHQQKKYKEDVN